MKNKVMRTMILATVCVFLLAACGKQKEVEKSNFVEKETVVETETKEDIEDAILDEISDVADIVESVVEETEDITNSNDETADGIRSEFKEAMDKYEEFYDEYYNFMVDYSKNPTNLKLIGDYTKMLGKLAEMDAEFAKWESGEMSNEELKYYLDVQARVSKKMIDATTLMQ